MWDPNSGTAFLKKKKRETTSLKKTFCSITNPLSAKTKPILTVYV